MRQTKVQAREEERSEIYMDSTEIVEAIESIPVKKENLRRAFENLQSSSSYTFTLQLQQLQWKDLEDHISSIETPILDRFNASLQQGATIDTATAITFDDGSNKNYKLPPSKAELLKSVCINMDFRGLRSYLSLLKTKSSSSNSRKRKPLRAAIRHDVALALRSAPEPALLVLNAMYGFNWLPPVRKMRQREGRRRELQDTRKACIYLLEIFHPISLETGIKPAIRERAARLAVEWRVKIPENDKSVDAALQARGFLRLIATYGLVPAFEADDIMELLCVCIWRKNPDVDLIKNLGFADKADNLIRKLNRKARELDAVKIVYAFNMADKVPPVPLLKAYVTRAKQRADELREKGPNSVQTQNDATTIEMSALASVLHAIGVYKLENEYPREDLLKRIAQLDDQKKADKKQAVASVAASNSMAQQKQQSSERPHPSPATSAPVIAANYYPQPIQSHPQGGLAVRAPCVDVAEPCDHAATGSVYNYGGPSLYGGLAATGSVYNHGGPSLSCITTNEGATRSLPRSHYSSLSLARTGSLNDVPVTNYTHHLVGLHSSHGSSTHPRLSLT